MEVISVSFVGIGEDLVTKVADHCGVSVEDIRVYLTSNKQDEALLRAFLFYGVGPMNKTFKVAP